MPTASNSPQLNVTAAAAAAVAAMQRAGSTDFVLEGENEEDDEDWIPQPNFTVEAVNGEELETRRFHLPNEMIYKVNLDFGTLGGWDIFVRRGNLTQLVSAVQFAKLFGNMGNIGNLDHRLKHHKSSTNLMEKESRPHLAGHGHENDQVLNRQRSGSQGSIPQRTKPPNLRQMSQIALPIRRFSHCWGKYIRQRNKKCGSRYDKAFVCSRRWNKCSSSKGKTRPRSNS